MKDLFEKIRHINIFVRWLNTNMGKKYCNEHNIDLTRKFGIEGRFYSSRFKEGEEYKIAFMSIKDLESKK